MKHLLVVFAVVLLDVVGCGSRHHEESPYLNVSTERIVLENQQGSSAVFEVYSNSKWTIVNNCASWLAVSPMSGKGDAKIVVTALSSNESTSLHTCIMIIHDEDSNREREVCIDQSGKAPVDNKEDGA